MAVTVEIIGVACKVDEGKWTCKNKSFQRHLKAVERLHRAQALFNHYPDPDEISAKEMIEYFTDLGLDAKIIDLGPEIKTVRNRIY